MSLAPRGAVQPTLVGSSVWNAALVLGGYALGSRFGQIGRYSDYINYAVYAVIGYLVVRFVVVRLRAKRSSDPETTGGAVPR